MDPELQRLLADHGIAPTPDDAAGPGAASTAKRLLWLGTNERHAPELLPFPLDEVRAVTDAIARQQAVVDRLVAEEAARAAEAEADGEGAAEFHRGAFLPFRAEHVYRLEITRLTYLLSDLIRLRVRKIQKQAAYILAQPPEWQAERLSDNERVLCAKLAEITERAAQRGGLELLPEPFRRLVPNPALGEGAEVLPQPNLDEFVFVAALETVSVALPGVEDEKELLPGEMWVCRYSTIRDHVIDGKMRLV